MRIGIFENIMTPGGHEVDFDRILVEELSKLGHKVSFYVPKGFHFAMDYHVPVQELPGEVVSYAGVTGVRKLFRTVQRETRRLGWYRSLFAAGKRGEVDALIIPTSTYRYLRALRHSVLRKSKIPVIFILHGINPKEAPKFLKAADALKNCANIRPTVLTFTNLIFGEQRENIRTIYPPTFVPRDISWRPDMQPSAKKTLTVGFFGQYRREKRLEDFLDVYLAGESSFARPVQLLVQGSTMHPEDAEDFERILAKYKGKGGISFLHKGLIGAEWQRAIAEVDILLMPYSAPRYRYHWGGMLFTAIGFQKPVIASDDMNPEVFSAYSIGKTFPSGNLDKLKDCLIDFINTYDREAPHYARVLSEAARAYSPAVFAERIVGILKDE